VDDFQRELGENLARIRAARAPLLEQLRRLSADDLEAMRRGGWSVREVLRHVIDSEVAYAKVIGFLRNSAADIANASDGDVTSGSAAADALERVRRTTLSLLDGIDEDTFYDLRALGREQYSVLSVLENVAGHDHEHLEQIARTLAARSS
jgi:uncharacterized damage-inducible protein DinB